MKESKLLAEIPGLLQVSHFPTKWGGWVVGEGVMSRVDIESIRLNVAQSFAV